MTEQGYTGSIVLLLEAIRSWRPPKLPRPLRHRSSRRRADPRKRRWLLLRPPERLNAEERTALDLLLANDPTLAKPHDLAQRFRKLLHERDLDGFHTWLADAQASDLSSFVGVANGMVADRDAVEAAFTEVWSNGVVEGTVHKIKLLKRQGYGRSKLDLPRRRLRAGEQSLSWQRAVEAPLDRRSGATALAATWPAATLAAPEPIDSLNLHWPGQSCLCSWRSSRQPTT
ncbi:MAG TPA: transposase [Chloroflexota bacterium]|nr:transposase [Chloroflexota bacterium]